jgi:hypothetical protein
MGLTVKHSISDRVRQLKRADCKPQVHLDLDKNRAGLAVIENGDCRLLPISNKVAEVLIANGFGYDA